MAIEFDCPNCQSRIRTPDEAAGKKARCPNCKQIAPVPIASSPLANLGPPSPSPFGSASGSAFEPFPSAPKPTPPAAPANPFSDLPASGGYSTGEINPYASPTGYGTYSAAPLSLEEIRGKLLGPAIGLALNAVLSIGMIAFFTVMIIADQEFQQNPQDEFIAGCVVLLLMAAFGAIPSLLGLVGAYAMFRGKGKVAAWVGAAASLVPCNPCFFIGMGFAIWGMVALGDPRVSAGIK